MQNFSFRFHLVLFIILFAFIVNNPAQSELKWTFSTGAPVYSSPSFDNDAVYIGSDDFNLYSIDAASGTKNWDFKTEGIIRCKPAISNESVFFASDDGNLYALNKNSGEQVWKYNIGNNIIRLLPEQPGTTGNYWDYMQSSPYVDNGIIYVGSGDSCVYALNASDGTLKWKTKTGGLVRSSPSVYEGIVYVGSWDGFIYALDIDDGSVIWKFNTRGAAYINVQPSPRIANGIVYCGSRNPYFYAIDAKSGKEIWKYSFGGSWVESSATIVDSVVYVGSSDMRAVLALNARTGLRVWRYNDTGYPWSTPFYYKGSLYVGIATFTRGAQTGGSIVAIGASDARLQWRLECGLNTTIGGVVSSPIVNNDIVYYGSLDGKVYAVKTLVTSVEDTQGSLMPEDYKMMAYPNPFNPETKIQINIPESGMINLSVFDSLGDKVTELVNGHMNSGIYELNFNASSLASGVYFPVLRIDKITRVIKTTYLK